jgi:hypothetical protein
VPVDPWGPKQAQRVIAARRRISEGLSALRDVGAHLQDVREKTIAAQPLAPDQDTGEGTA